MEDRVDGVRNQDRVDTQIVILLNSYAPGLRVSKSIFQLYKRQHEGALWVLLCSIHLKAIASFHPQQIILP